MRNRTIVLTALLTLFFTTVTASVKEIANEPDSVYLFSYATAKNNNKNGLHFAWSLDRKNWHPIGPEYSYLKSDYGSWGPQKRMLSPFIYQDREGTWHILFSVNEQDGVLGHAWSADLVNWRPQDYVVLLTEGNCMEPEITFDPAENRYQISWTSHREGADATYSSATTDFHHFSAATADHRLQRGLRETITLSGEKQYGTINKVAWRVVDGLLKARELATYKNAIHAETTAEDPVRFAGLETVNATVRLFPENKKTISDMLIGVFFEDINYGADGGLYAELIQNRGFEYTPADTKGRDPSWNHLKAWSPNRETLSYAIETAEPIHPHNQHYLVLDIREKGEGVINEGFNGIPVREKAKYDLSLFARSLDGNKGSIRVRLIGNNGEIYGEAVTKPIGKEWKKYEATLTATGTVDDARLEVIPELHGKVALDMVSLFPRETFKGRKNGLRKDLAEVIAAMKPKFVRFPGGCVAHGDGLNNLYLWQHTVGPLEARKPQRNIWNYHQTGGLGYYEYFQFCEDIGAEPIPIVAAGVPCQNSSTGGHGQQCGIPMEEMQDYIQSLFDLVEWANGDKNTKWGKVRAAAGHPQPFHLKYLGVGNEDLISNVFKERFEMIYNAFREKHPEITIIGTAGPFNEGPDYVEGWELAGKLGVPILDEHYYQTPGWYIHNQDFYDKYNRNGAKVYLGEYAAHLPGRPNNLETALAEALHILSMERNGDIVCMSSYAPLLAKEGFTQWNPDLIYFTNTEVKPTVGYWIQQLCSTHPGDEYIPSLLTLSHDDNAVRKRVALSVVRDSNTDELIVKLVNLLPVAVHTAISLDDLPVEEQVVERMVLSGEPDDRSARPYTDRLAVGTNFDCELPAYSFTLFRVKCSK